MYQDMSARAENVLEAMDRHARAIGAEGVAVFAWKPDEDGIQWDGRMRVVDLLTKSFGGKSFNLVSIAWAKAAEMMVTLQNSGTAQRELLSGEYGFIGGAIEKAGGGMVLASFSGSSSENDLEVAEVGLRSFREASDAR